ncbi:MAG: hypothetical protein ACI36X_09670 [Bacteroidaceae bacterium]
MVKNLLSVSIRWLLLAGWLGSSSACSHEEPFPSGAADEPASLSLTFAVPRSGIAADTRGLSDLDENLATWTPWELAVDGRSFFRVMVMLIRASDSRLVAYRDLYYGSGDINAENGFLAAGGTVSQEMHYGDKVQVTFSYDAPVHGDSDTSIERLSRGSYWLMAVANYSDFTPPGDSEHTYAGLKDGTVALTDVLESIKSDFANHLTDGCDFASGSTAYTAFQAFKVHAGAGNVCPQEPQPLTLVQRIDLQPGMNTVSAEMKRLYARLRVELINNSGSQYLTVRAFSFCDSIGKDMTYLFDNPAKPEAKYGIGAYGAPDVQSGNAFTKLGTVPFGLSPGEKRLLFDGYVLESRVSNPYTYRLNVAYADAGGYNLYQLDETPLTTVAEVNADYTARLAAGEDVCYVMQNQNKQYRFLQNGSTQVSSGTAAESLAEVKKAVEQYRAGEAYGWKLIRRGNSRNSQYYIATVGQTPYYMGNPVQDGNVPLTTGQSVYFTLQSGQNGGNICMKSSASSNYINVYGGEQDRVAGWYETDAGSQFWFYPLTVRQGVPEFDKEVTVETFDLDKAYVRPLTEIGRNHLVRVYVSVSYNPETQDFEYKVLPWEEKTGDIDFN